MFYFFYSSYTDCNFQMSHFFAIFLVIQLRKIVHSVTKPNMIVSFLVSANTFWDIIVHGSLKHNFCCESQQLTLVFTCKGNIDKLLIFRYLFYCQFLQLAHRTSAIMSCVTSLLSFCTTLVGTVKLLKDGIPKTLW